MIQYSSKSPASDGSVEYVGFWARVLASLIDTVALGLVMGAIGVILGIDFSIDLEASGTAYWQGIGVNEVLSSAIIIGFWLWKMATPGKMVISAIIVDADTLGKPSVGQMIGRYLGYFVSIFGLMLGFLWVAFDDRKQGWHDKMAGTVVIKKPVA